MTPNPWLLLAVAISAFVIGLSKGGLGGTAVTLVTPVLTLAMPDRPGEAIGIALPLLLVGDAFAMWVYWRGWDRNVVLRMLPGTILGIIVGSVLLSALKTVIGRAVGVFALVFVGYKLWGRRLRQDLARAETRPWYGSLFGSGCGLASALANAGGPIADAYLLMQRLSPASFIGTAALYFTLVNTMKIPGFLRAGVLQPITFLQVAWAIPFVPLGVWVGKRMIDQMEIKAFENVLLVLLSVAAIFLLVR
jgi:uncharacterized protein